MKKTNENVNNENIDKIRERIIEYVFLGTTILLIGGTMMGAREYIEKHDVYYTLDVITDSYEGVGPNKMLGYVNDESLSEEFSLKSSFTEDDILYGLETGEIIKWQYGNSPFYVYCIKVPNGTNNYFVPSGYDMYQELVGMDYGNGTVYERTNNFHTKDIIRKKLR